MIVILNVRTTKKFYRVRYWRAIFVFSHVGDIGLLDSRLSTTVRAHPLSNRRLELTSSFESPLADGVTRQRRDGEDGRRVPASPDISKRDALGRQGTVTFADVVNSSTHTGCLSHCTIEGAELSIPRAVLSRSDIHGRAKLRRERNRWRAGVRIVVAVETQTIREE